MLNSLSIKFLSYLEPIRVFELFNDKPYAFFLDSSLKNHNLGRYSFIGFDPFKIIKINKDLPFNQITEALNLYKLPHLKHMPAFLGGLVGYFSYDLGFLLEKVNLKSKNDLNLANCVLGLYDLILAFDHYKKKTIIISSGFPEKNTHLAKIRADYRIKEVLKILSNYKPQNKKNSFLEKSKPINLESNFSKNKYLEAVSKAKNYIKEGDIYQVNLSQRFSGESRVPSLNLYQRLRQNSPSFFSAYFDCQDYQIISSSPERFLCLDKKRVITSPMKGTRPRSNNNKKDNFLKKELLKSIKDKAELMMIVDLERNDLGRICSYNSIKVNSMRSLEKYKTVYQTTATISGKLYPNKNITDLLKATFPGGSITGCPKIRAMQIIEELEPHRRGIYTGSLGYISFTGDMDLNILIRTILKIKNQVYFQVGGGIVADSIAEKEYEETLVKAKAMKEALSYA